MVPGQTQFNIDDRDFQSIYVPICQALLRYTTPVLEQLEPDQPVEATFDPSGTYYIIYYSFLGKRIFIRNDGEIVN